MYTVSCMRLTTAWSPRTSQENTLNTTVTKCTRKDTGARPKYISIGSGEYLLKL